MHRHAPAVGEPLPGQPPVDAPRARLPGGPRTPRLAPHPAQRNPAAAPAGHLRPCQDAGVEQGVGRREVHRADVLVHPRILLSHRV